ncbi:MAG: HAMP domain-containing sensor histidine kinase [Pseudomonadota bacterium]
MIEEFSQREIFARALSQDYASLLRSARQLSAYVREDMLRDDPDAAMHALGMLDLRLAGMDRFINDLIRYCRAGQRDVMPEQFSISELAEIVFRRQNAHPEAKLILSVTQDQIVADLAAMRIVLHELFSNAIKHHPNSSALELTFESSAAVGSGVIIAVTDNGDGVPDTMLQKIANPFVKLSTNGKTSGLGLSIVARELQAMDAQLQLRKRAEGLSAVIVLPHHMSATQDSRRPAIEKLDSSSSPQLRIV